MTYPFKESSIAHVYNIDCTESGCNKIGRFSNSTFGRYDFFRQFSVAHAITNFRS